MNFYIVFAIFNLDLKMASLNNIIKRAMSLMKAHLEYSQNLAVEFSDLIKDYEELVEAPEDIVIKAQEEVEIEAI